MSVPSVAIPQMEGLQDQPQLYEALDAARAGINLALSRITGGTAKLALGVATVPAPQLREGSLLVAMIRTPAGTPGILAAPTTDRRSGAYFVVRSSSATDASTFDWLLLNP